MTALAKIDPAFTDAQGAADQPLEQVAGTKRDVVGHDMLSGEGTALFAISVLESGASLDGGEGTGLYAISV